MADEDVEEDDMIVAVDGNDEVEAEERWEGEKQRSSEDEEELNDEDNEDDERVEDMNAGVETVVNIIGLPVVGCVGTEATTAVTEGIANEVERAENCCYCW